MAISFNAIGQAHVSFSAAESAQAGKVCKLTENGTVGACEAGDSFCGSFLSHYVDGMDPLDCAIRGAVTSSLVMEGWGVLSTLRIPQGTAEERLALVREEVRRGIQRIV